MKAKNSNLHQQIEEIKHNDRNQGSQGKQMHHDHDKPLRQERHKEGSEEKVVKAYLT